MLFWDEDELVRCFGTEERPDPVQDIRVPIPVSTAMQPRRIMLAPQDSALRMEQDRLLGEWPGRPGAVVCEARPDILRTLSVCGAAATILPARSLGQEALSRCRSFEEPQDYYLLLVHHPGRNLPAFVKDLVRLLNDTFETYFSNHDQ